MNVAIGVMVYNEEENIENTLKALGNQNLDTIQIESITVVASGCTDNTVPIVKKIMEKDQRIHLIEQTERNGKTYAVNTFLDSVQSNIYLLIGGDSIPHNDAVEELAKPLHNQSIGMTGARPVPLNSTESFVGYCVHNMWYLHHLIALENPKMGEMISFRADLGKLSPTAYADEESYAAICSEEGYEIRYIPNAIVFNKGPESVSDFIAQRRRNHCIHLQLQNERGFSPATMNTSHIVRKLLRVFVNNPRYAGWTIGMVALEAYSRMLGTVDFRKGDKSTHKVWQRIATSKKIDSEKILALRLRENSESKRLDESAS